MATGRPARTRSAGTGGGEVKALDIETQMMVDGHDSEDHGALEDHGDSEDDNSDDDDDDSADDDSLRQVQELPARGGPGGRERGKGRAAGPPRPPASR